MRTRSHFKGNFDPFELFLQFDLPKEISKFRLIEFHLGGEKRTYETIPQMNWKRFFEFNKANKIKFKFERK